MQPLISNPLPHCIAVFLLMPQAIRMFGQKIVFFDSTLVRSPVHSALEWIHTACRGPIVIYGTTTWGQKWTGSIRIDIDLKHDSGKMRIIPVDYPGIFLQKDR
jgi:hypothetical protein